MRKFLIKISTVIIAVLVLCTFIGCSTTQDEQPKLTAPEVVISYDGLAVWGEVDNALHYIYVIDDGAETSTAKCSVQLEENRSIKVKAVSGKEGYADSDYSAPQKYVKTAPVEHPHTDVNNDGICDKCSTSVTVELSFYAVNDLHGKVMDNSGSQPGVDEFTTYMKALYADDAREEILLSSGDMWQGTVESSSNKGQLMTEWMNEVGFVSMTLGNHEYDWGAGVIASNAELANFPLLAINVTQDGKAVDYCQPSTVVERGGVKIGIIGAIGNCLSSISGDFTDGLEFATGGNLSALVKKESERLRNEEDCDFIVFSIHDGGTGFSAAGVNYVTDGEIRYYDTALSDGYVDLVFEGHSHQRYILQDKFGIYHLQGGGENSGISSAEVTLNTANGKYDVRPKLISNSVYASSSIEGDPVVEQIFNKYFPDNNPYTTVLGTNASRKNSDDITKQVAKLYYEAGVKKWGSQYNIVFGGGYLNTRSPYVIEKGDVTYANIFSVLPFDNEIVLGKVNGSALRNLLSKTNYVNYATISSNEIVDSKDYYIIVDSYSSTYKYNNITEVARLGSGTYARDLLAEFVAAGGWKR